MNRRQFPNLLGAGSKPSLPPLSNTRATPYSQNMNIAPRLSTQLSASSEKSGSNPNQQPHHVASLYPQPTLSFSSNDTYDRSIAYHNNNDNNHHQLINSTETGFQTPAPRQIPQGSHQMNLPPHPHSLPLNASGSSSSASYSVSVPRSNLISQPPQRSSSISSNNTMVLGPNHDLSSLLEPDIISSHHQSSFAPNPFQSSIQPTLGGVGAGGHIHKSLSHSQFPTMTSNHPHASSMLSQGSTLQRRQSEMVPPHSTQHLLSQPPPSLNPFTTATPTTPATPLIAFDGSSLVPLSQLRTIQEQSVFRAYPHFNVVQSRCFHSVYEKRDNLTISAPTGCGKTGLFEIAICSLLSDPNASFFANKSNLSGKIVYVAPLRAICDERYRDWKAKFQDNPQIGLKIEQYTGNGANTPIEQLQLANIIITTPENLNGLSKRWSTSPQCRLLLDSIQLLLIDEVHILDDITRGSCIEGCITRFKLMHDKYRNSPNQQTLPLANLRMIALSATIPNLQDISNWIGGTCLEFGEQYRPVALDKIVLTFPEGSTNGRSNNDWMFLNNLNYRLLQVLKDHSEGKPALIFHATRKECLSTGKQLLTDAQTQGLFGYRHGASPFVSSKEQEQKLIQASSRVENKQLAELLRAGIGAHHAGLTPHDCHIVEELFATGDLPIVNTTSTLAQGVNFPTYLVVIKGTMVYNTNKHCYEEIPVSQVLQMAGRAGRPQFETTGKVVIMTKPDTAWLYQHPEMHPIESHLQLQIVEHLNAEIAICTIQAISDLFLWLENTYWYVRATSDKTSLHIDVINALIKLLKERCVIVFPPNGSIHDAIDPETIDAQTLSSYRDFIIQPLQLCTIIANTGIKFESISTLQQLPSVTSMADLVRIVADSPEFSEITIRQGDKTALLQLNKLIREQRKQSKSVAKSTTTTATSQSASLDEAPCQHEPGLRFPLPISQIKTSGDKIFLLFQAGLDMSTTSLNLNHDLTRDKENILTLAFRLLKAMVEFSLHEHIYIALRFCLYLSKSREKKLWAISAMNCDSAHHACCCMDIKHHKISPQAINILNTDIPNGHEYILGQSITKTQKSAKPSKSTTFCDGIPIGVPTACSCSYSPAGILTQLDGIGAAINAKMIANGIHSFSNLEMNLSRLVELGVTTNAKVVSLQHALKSTPQLSVSIEWVPVSSSSSNEPSHYLFSAMLHQNRPDYAPRKQTKGSSVRENCACLILLGSPDGNEVLHASNQRGIFLPQGVSHTSIIRPIAVAAGTTLLLDVVVKGYIGLDISAKITAPGTFVSKANESATATSSAISSKWLLNTKSSDPKSIEDDSHGNGDPSASLPAEHQTTGLSFPKPTSMPTNDTNQHTIRHENQSNFQNEPKHQEDQIDCENWFSLVNNNNNGTNSKPPLDSGLGHALNQSFGNVAPRRESSQQQQPHQTTAQRAGGLYSRHKTSPKTDPGANAINDANSPRKNTLYSKPKSRVSPSSSLAPLSDHVSDASVRHPAPQQLQPRQDQAQPMNLEGRSVHQHTAPSNNTAPIIFGPIPKNASGPIFSLIEKQRQRQNENGGEAREESDDEYQTNLTSNSHSSLPSSSLPQQHQQSYNHTPTTFSSTLSAMVNPKQFSSNLFSQFAYNPTNHRPQDPRPTPSVFSNASTSDIPSVSSGPTRPSGQGFSSVPNTWLSHSSKAATPQTANVNRAQPSSLSSLYNQNKGSTSPLSANGGRAHVPTNPSAMTSALLGADSPHQFSHPAYAQLPNCFERAAQQAGTNPFPKPQTYSHHQLQDSNIPPSTSFQAPHREQHIGLSKELTQLENMSVVKDANHKRFKPYNYDQHAPTMSRYLEQPESTISSSANQRNTSSTSAAAHPPLESTSFTSEYCPTASNVSIGMSFPRESTGKDAEHHHSHAQSNGGSNSLYKRRQPFN